MKKGYQQEPAAPPEPSAYRASFEGWIVPNDGLMIKEPVGPFDIEVSLQEAGRQQQWKALLLPVRALFGGRGFRTAKECQEMVQGSFRKQVAGWKGRFD